jgi:hypothetical protein
MTPRGSPRTHNFNIRLSEDELARIESAARRVSPSLTASAWVRDVALREAGPDGPECGRCFGVGQIMVGPGVNGVCPRCKGAGREEVERG